MALNPKNLTLMLQKYLILKVLDSLNENYYKNSLLPRIYLFWFDIKSKMKFF